MRITNAFCQVTDKLLVDNEEYSFVECMPTNHYKAIILNSGVTAGVLELTLQVTEADQLKRYEVGQEIKRSWDKYDVNSGTTIIYDNNYEKDTHKLMLTSSFS